MPVSFLSWSAPCGTSACAGDVFLAPVRWRPSSRCTGSASPCTCLTAGLQRLGLERPSQGPTCGAPSERLLGSPLIESGRGSWSASGHALSQEHAPGFTRGVADPCELLITCYSC